jgi:hypothetical protein
MAVDTGLSADIGRHFGAGAALLEREQFQVPVVVSLVGREVVADDYPSVRCGFGSNLRQIRPIIGWSSTT